MARSIRARFAATLLVGGTLALRGAGRERLFVLSVPVEMVTGRVLVRAEAADRNIAAVKWTVDDWSRLTPPLSTSGPCRTNGAWWRWRSTGRGVRSTARRRS